VVWRRETGYREALRASGIVPDPDWVAHGDSSMPGAHSATERLLLLPDAHRPTAVIATNLTAALGAMGALRAHGWRIPQDLSLMAFDDHPIEAFLDPPLTVIRMPMRAMGAHGAAMLFAAIGGEPIRHLVVSDAPELVLRGSTGPPPGP
jgi:LacI family transcriptional regulator